MIKTIKTAIFDLDGTLINSCEMWRTIGERYVRSLGKIPADDLSERLWKRSLFDAAKILKEEYDIKFSESEMTEQVLEMTDSYYRFEAEAKRGAKELVKMLYERGLTLYVLTSSGENQARAALKRLGLSGYFADIVGGADKSKPECFLKLSGEPRQTLVFEDSLYAVKSAKAAGFITCAVYDSFESSQSELRETADFFENDLFGYPDILERI